MDLAFVAPAPTFRRRRPSSWWAAVATTVVPLGTAAAILAVSAASGPPPQNLSDGLVSGAFLAWNLVPVAGSAALLLWAGRRGWLPYAAAALGNVTLALVTAQGLHEFWTSGSSTAALMFVFLPFAQWSVVSWTAGLVALACWWSSRRSVSTPTR